MSIVHIDWHPDGPALRRFGRTTLIGSLLIAAVFYWLKHWETAAYVMAGLGVVIGGLALTGTGIGRPGYLFWMGIAFVMGNIVSRIILAIVYFLVVTPLGLIARATGRDKLALRARGRPTHWVDLHPEQTEDHYERQF